MSNITVFSRAEKTDVKGKVVIENVWKEMKEAKVGSSFTSDVFHAEDFAFQLEICLNGDNEDSEHNISAFILNATDNPVLLTNVCYELKAIPKNSTETVTLVVKAPLKEVEIPARLGHGFFKLISHDDLKEACEEGDDLLLLVKAQLQGKEIKISSSTGLNRTRGRKYCAGDEGH